MKNKIKQYHSHILFIGLSVCLLHGAKLNSNVIGIDTEDLIRSKQNLYRGWLGTGRQGLVLLKYLFGNSRFDPYFSGMMTLVLFTLAVSAFFLLWDKIGGGRQKQGLTAWALGGIMWISHPVLAEQFYFSLQSMEICICFLLTAGALYLSGLWAEKKPVRGRNILFPLSVAMLLVTFSGYQVFVAFYIFGVSSSLLLQYVAELASDSPFSIKDFGIRLGRHILLFLTAFLINMAVTKVFFSRSDYLGQQILWGKINFTDNLRNIKNHIYQVLTGAGSPFYHGVFGLLCAISFLLLLLTMHRHKGCGRIRYMLLICLYLAVTAAPFLMTVVLGGSPVLRSQLVLPVTTGFLAYLCIALLRQARLPGDKTESCVLALLVLVCVSGGIGQAKVTGALYYTDRCRYEQDAALAGQIIQRLKLVNRQELPVVFVGSLEFEPNSACVEGEIIGKSFFDYDTEIEPIGYWSTRRILGFLHVMGADYAQVPAERMGDALKYGTNMAMWPEDNCVEIWDDMVVVKLSDYSSGQ